MRIIQEVGTEILGGNPNKFYVFCGSEYGVKRKYLQMLQDHYGNKVEVPTVDSVLSMMNTKRLIPLKPSLYVVRYDESFISTLSDKTKLKIDQCNILGTLVCIYESSSHTSKLDKYLPTYTVSIDSVNTRFLMKYLKSDFPELPDRLLEVSARYSSNYSQAYSVCSAMSVCETSKLFSMQDVELCKLFGLSQESDVEQLRLGVASRNFRYLLNTIDNYSGDLDSCLYTILSVCLEIEKILGSKFAESDLREYLNRWSYEDVYNLFMVTYEELKKLRTISSNTYASLVYIASLLQFKRIPSVEDMR